MKHSTIIMCAAAALAVVPSGGLAYTYHASFCNGEDNTTSRSYALFEDTGALANTTQYSWREFVCPIASDTDQPHGSKSFGLVFVEDRNDYYYNEDPRAAACSTAYSAVGGTCGAFRSTGYTMPNGINRYIALDAADISPAWHGSHAWDFPYLHVSLPRRYWGDNSPTGRSNLRAYSF